MTAVIEAHELAIGWSGAALAEHVTFEVERGEIPIVRSASISSLTRIVPSSAANAAPERPARITAVISGTSSRVTEIPTMSAT